MHLSRTSRQIICLFCAVVFLYCYVAVVSTDKISLKTCCPKVSKARFKGQIEKCGYLHPKGRCLEAYVFATKNGQYCIMVKARWLNATLEKIKKEGNPCENM